MRVSEVPVELDRAERPSAVGGGGGGRLPGTLARDDLIAAATARGPRP